MERKAKLTELTELTGVADIYRDALFDVFDFFSPKVKILVVVDPSISLTPGTNAFGIGKMIAHLRSERVGCMRFEVTLARRAFRNLDGPIIVNASPTAAQPKYERFHFDDVDTDGDPIINRFHEVWCFGFEPGNDAGPDTNIGLASRNPASPSELNVLTRFMNERKGGVFATGDHDYLGASMCSQIPRIRTMRRWTNADGVPPIGGEFNPDTADRIDTNRPATPGELNTASPDEIPFENQADAVPQRIEWVAHQSVIASPLFIRRRPHPVLCHPTHGPIDVMPDHPHEGLCFDNHEVDVDRPLGISGLSGDEYPTHGGVKPVPKVIAYGNTTPDPPYDLEKGTSPARRFPMISVYDGHQANVGRVATDSTWHHWMDINLPGMEADPDQTNFEKVMRYFVNLAVWLAPPSVRRRCLVVDLSRAQFEYVGMHELSRDLSTRSLGRTLRHYLYRTIGPCWVNDLLVDWIRELHPEFWREIIPRPNPCLTCPPFEWIEDAMLGGMGLAAMATMEPVKDAIHEGEVPRKLLDLRVLESAYHQAVKTALSEFGQDLRRSFKQDLKRFENLISKKPERPQIAKGVSEEESEELEAS